MADELLLTEEQTEARNPYEGIERDWNSYIQCRTLSYASDFENALHQYTLINTDSAVMVAKDFVNQLLHIDGKNRKVSSENYGSDSSSGETEHEADTYYQTALTVAMNQYLTELKEANNNYETYAQVIAIFLISEGLKDMLDGIELPDSIRSKSENVLMAIDDKIHEITREIQDAIRTTQPDIYTKFIELGPAVVAEPTSTVVARWFTTEKNEKLLSEENISKLTAARTEYLRYVKRTGRVELGVLLQLFGMINSTYNRYKRDMISAIIPKCDAALMSYVKHLLLSR